MDAVAALSVYAQLAVALTGFAGLFTAFRGLEKWSPVEIVGLRILLLMSVGALAFAALPIPFLLGGAGEWVWTAALAGLGAFCFYFFAAIFIIVFKHKIRPRIPALFWPIVIGQGSTALLMFLAAADIAPRGPAVYCGGLTWLLAVATLQFLLQIFSAITAPAASTGLPPEPQSR